jgi:hypothetical protein
VKKISQAADCHQKVPLRKVHQKPRGKMKIQNRIAKKTVEWR